MADLLKKIIYTGVGIVTTASEKLQKNIDDISEKGDESREEGRKVFDEILDTTEAKKEEVEGKMKDIITNIMKSLNIPTKDEFNQLVERLGALEDAIEKSPKAKTTRAKSTARKATTRARSTAKKTTTRAKSTAKKTTSRAKTAAKKTTTRAKSTAKKATTTARKTTAKKAPTATKTTATKAANTAKDATKDTKK